MELATYVLVHGVPINVIRHKYENCDTINTKKCAYIHFFIHIYNVHLDINSMDKCISQNHYQYTDEIPDSLPTYTFMQKRDMYIIH